jgi:hypothetical protein
LYPVRVQNRQARAGKEKSMEMTDKQYIDLKTTLIELVLEKLENSKDLEEAKEKIKDLLPKE